MSILAQTIGSRIVSGKYVAMLGSFLLLAACTTHIQPQDQTQTPPTVPFGQFKLVLLKPLANQTPEDFPPEAVARVQNGFQACLAGVLGRVLPYSDDMVKANPNALVVEPSILNGKKVSVGARIMFGALAGSSAVQMQVIYKSAKDGAVLAQPVFYAKAAAMSGAWTFGAQDNEMLDRLPQSACQYSFTYRDAH